MERYFFDIHDGCRLTHDATGTTLEHQKAAWVTAARILLDISEDASFFGGTHNSHLFVQIRRGPDCLGTVDLFFAGVRVHCPA